MLKFKKGQKAILCNPSFWTIDYGFYKGDIVTIGNSENLHSIELISRDGKRFVYQKDFQIEHIGKKLFDLLTGSNLSRLSTALGKHRSYLNKLIQVGCSDKTYNKIKDKLTIDWNSDKPLYVNDGVHVPFTIKPINCVQQKHKDWVQSLMMKGCVKL